MDSALKIIVVEDHDELREVTVEALSAMGYAVRGVDCAEALDEVLPSFSVDLLVLDLNLPGEDGISIARRLRKAQPSIGIVMVTARDAAKDMLRGYDSGADIYLTKPTSPEALGAAIRALARRMRPQAEAGQTALTLDTAVLQLKGPHSAIDVSDQESLLLSALARAGEHRLETWQLLELTGKSTSAADKKALAVQIVRLRKKLMDAGAPEPTIKSIRSTGYQLCVALEVLA
jgi:DNA-binding response OmpR family regulator